MKMLDLGYRKKRVHKRDRECDAKGKMKELGHIYSTTIVPIITLNTFTDNSSGIVLQLNECGRIH